MKNYRVQVVEPSAEAVLEDLARRKMIYLEPGESADEFLELVKKFRSIGDPLSLEEITAEVEAVRQERYDRMNED